MLELLKSIVKLVKLMKINDLTIKTYGKILITNFSTLMSHFSQNAVAHALPADLNFIANTKNTQKLTLFRDLELFKV